MPIYNGEKFLKEAIESILKQTFSDFELLVINDSSTDNTEKIILSYKDKRIIYLKNDQNLGLIKTLNKGLEIAQGEFIARMDHDDISVTNRFEKQLEVFATNPEIGVCGTWFTLFGKNQLNEIIKHPINPEDIKIALLGSCVLGHPTVMFRKIALANLRYDNDYNFCEDFEFWTRLSRITKIYNIPESLLNYRFHDTNLSILNGDLQWENTKKTIGNQLQHINLEINEQIIRFCWSLFSNQNFNLSTAEFMKVVNFANLLEAKNKQVNFYNQKHLKNMIKKKLEILFDSSLKDNWRIIPFLLKSRKELILKRNLFTNLQLIAKLIFK